MSSYSTFQNNAPDNNDMQTNKKYANRHIPRFLDLAAPPLTKETLQVVTNGQFLTAQSLYNGDNDDASRYNASIPIYVTDTPQSIGMTVPHDLTMRKLGDIIGPGYPVSVIDVEHQEELEGWTLGDLVEYFEDEERLLGVSKEKVQQDASVSGRRQRKTVLLTNNSAAANKNSPKVLNQISLEFRNTPLAAHVKSPRFVRDLDWIDHVWKKEKERPQTQYYCLTSTAGCYTDFHVDFGGTSVWYHVLSGVKQFCLIPPTAENLQVYEDWLCRPNQAELFLPDMMMENGRAQKISLRQGQTLFIPSGWIHAVYTPTDSLVIGGNFLHGLDMKQQIDVHSLEMRTRVPAKFRFPKYLATMMHAGVWYVQKLRQGNVCRREVEGLETTLLQALREWSRVPSDPHMVQAMNEIINGNGDSIEECMLQQLQEELDRIKTAGCICPNPKYKNVVVAPATVKPKLRLKLSSDTTTTASSSSPFRITLSSGSQFSSVPANMKKRKAAREDLDSYISSTNNGNRKNNNDGDDEWKPSARLSLSTTTTDSFPTTKKRSLAVKKSKRPVAVKKSTTSRQRLMKRFR